MGQTLCIMIVATYYSSIMAITLRYLIASFSAVLPWSECNENWIEPCYPSSGSAGGNITWGNGTQSSAELYFM
jgi:solute carrier family 6 amino acid transporter-like protein 5/7/9/14